MVETRDAARLAFSLLLILCLATLTLWIPAYWPVGVFESTVFAIAGVALLQARFPTPALRFPLYMFGSIVAWGCLQWILGRTVDRFATEQAILKWMAFAAVYYVGAISFQDDDLSRRVRTCI